jgi:hypothetical protein
MKKWIFTASTDSEKEYHGPSARSGTEKPIVIFRGFPCFFRGGSFQHNASPTKG